MAKILDKPFDATKKILRTIFLGKPNLFTTSDVNRQVEALKYQMDSIEDIIGVESDSPVACSWQGGDKAVLYFLGTYVKAKGVYINTGITVENYPRVEILSSAIKTDSSNPKDYTFYFYLKADVKTVTYADDSSHTISGAKFADGTAMAAANQLVLGDIRYAATNNFEEIQASPFYVILAKVVFSTNTYRLYSYVIRRGITLLEEVTSRFTNYNDSWQIDLTSFICNYKLYNGFLHIAVNTKTGTLNGGGNHIILRTTFSQQVKQLLIDHFTNMSYNYANYTTSFADSSGSYIFIPYGAVYGNVQGKDTLVFGHCGLCIQRATGGAIVDVYYAAVFDCVYEGINSATPSVTSIASGYLKPEEGSVYRYYIPAHTAIIPIIA